MAMFLTGVDVPHAFWTLEERRGNVGEPFAVRTLLGWSLMGSVLASAGKTLAVHHVTTADEVLEHNVKKLWQLDATSPRILQVFLCQRKIDMPSR